ncbi:MAG: hypothetical protein HOV79_29915 [Hamadaea sp.]|nr:hypothetical protein [Hamadaea sp.]
MSRQRVTRDPTESMGTGTLALEQLVQVLLTLSAREAGVIQLRFGLNDGLPRTLEEIGDAYGITRERVRQIESKVMSKLRHPSRSDVLRDYLFLDDLRRLPDGLRRRILGVTEDPLPMVRCDRHGWTEQVAGGRVCGNCPCRVLGEPRGRPRRYCCDACRTSASRARLRARATDGAADEIP